MLRLPSQIVPWFLGLLPVALPLSAPGQDSGAAERSFADHSLGELQERLHQIDHELELLAGPSYLAGVGPIGYRSRTHESGDASEWIRIDWGDDAPIDEIILVPAIAHDSAKGIIADGFPKDFRIVAGSSGDPDGTEIARRGEADGVSIGPAPVVIAVDGHVASWIRIEASQLSARGLDGLHILQFSEIMVYQGDRNVALRQKVTTSSAVRANSNAWNEAYLVDGILPYVMDAAHGQRSLAYLGSAEAGTRHSFVLDLEQAQPVSSVQFHSIDTSDTIPQSAPVDFGIPRRMLVEGAVLPDFSDAVPLVEVRQDSVYECGPIMTRHFPARSCRYVRMTTEELSSVGMNESGLFRVGFAEIEIFANGGNVALGRKFEIRNLREGTRPPAALTDGRNQFGDILPVREWLRQLARRQELRGLRPRIVAEQNLRYSKLKRTFTWLGWLVAALAAAIVVSILNNRVARQRAIFRTRQQIAADLHDELGADIHAIGLLGDLAMRATHSPEKLETHLRRIRALTERTAGAARHCTNMLEADDLFGDLEEDMHRVSRRTMAGIDHEIEITGQELLARLQPRKRIDLFLFFRECLTNIIRHSEATRVTTRLIAEPSRIRLTITDNGVGMGGSPQQEVPSSLKRRARLLGACVTNETPPGEGSRINLNLRLRRRDTR